ncbi:FAD-binding oxidoreductase [Actinoallomurus sp. CA-150999]|uniref:FAD-binding oxidoreductase n=1 Tax=Actinoallomurus sp. CA-150999 TaxID=3239887 RepID=UPI003D94B019
MEELDIWNGAVSARPAVVRRCHDIDEVRDALRQAAAEGLPLAVRGGGHDWAGRAVRQDGLVIDLRGLRTVLIDGDVARVGGGATAADLIAAAAPAGKSAATGTVGGVGMAGLTLGGGYGPLCGIAGLAADNLLSAEVVLADGTVVTASDGSRPELFWALRGGGGNFGVVTSMVIRLQPIPLVYGGTILFPFTQAPDVLAGFGELVASASDELTAQTGVISAPDGTPVLFVKPTWSSTPDEGAHWIKRIEDLGEPIMSSVTTMDYGEPLRRGDEAFARDGRHYACRTRNLAALTPDVAQALVTAATARTSPLSALSLHHFHGAATRVPVTSTAFGLRREHFMVEILASWRPGEGDEAAHRRWADTTADLLEPLALPGGYPNMLAGEHRDQTAHAYGPNAERLAAVKKEFDPDGVFVATPLPDRL